jgi:hypothetical protein
MDNNTRKSDTQLGFCSQPCSVAQGLYSGSSPFTVVRTLVLEFERQLFVPVLCAQVNADELTGLSFSDANAGMPTLPPYRHEDCV